MAVQNTQNQNIFGNQSSECDWVVIDGKNYRKQTDEKGDYIVKGGTEKVYLSDYYYQKSVQARKDKVQNDITNFFTKQENDFAGWRDNYASQIAIFTKKIEANQNSILKFNAVEQTNIALLNPLYEKYNTQDISQFTDTGDKSKGYTFDHNRKEAHHKSNVASSLISTEKWIIEGYRRLMNHSESCRKQVVQIAQRTFSA